MLPERIAPQTGGHSSAEIWSTLEEFAWGEGKGS
jgi:hypothetical protein